MANDSGRIVAGRLVREDSLSPIPGHDPIEGITIHFDQSGRTFGMETWTDEKDFALALLDQKLNAALAAANKEKEEIENYIAIVRGSIDTALKSAGGRATTITIGNNEEDEN